MVRTTFTSSQMFPCGRRTTEDVTWKALPPLSIACSGMDERLKV
jgi:hypothetical protein